MENLSILQKLVQEKNLTAKETSLFLDEVMSGTMSPTLISAVLTALSMKGETVEEILGLIQTMRENMTKVHMPGAIDVCGTGGDRSGSFNISTAAAFVVAGAGGKVAKHGNRAASSKCGSADVLEELGVNIKLEPKQAEAIFHKIGMIFLFAPLSHQSLKHVAAVRKELKIRTIFNVLGPFANPAAVKRQLIGVPDKEIAEKLALVGSYLGYEHLLIVAGDDGFDEVSLASSTHLFEVKNTSIVQSIIKPQDFGFLSVSQTDFVGGSAKENADIIKDILNGEKGPKRDIVILNSAFALYVAGAVSTVKEGLKIAEYAIDHGHAKSVLEQLIKETQYYA